MVYKHASEEFSYRQPKERKPQNSSTTHIREISGLFDSGIRARASGEPVILGMAMLQAALFKIVLYNPEGKKVLLKVSYRGLI